MLVNAQDKIEDLIQSFVELSKDAEIHQLEEHEASIKIQKTWRRKLVEFKLRRWNKAATNIQRTYRGHLGRVRYNLKQVEVWKENQRAFFNAKATRIQSAFRGFYSRKYVHSFYDRKQFISESMLVGDIVKKDLCDHNHTLSEDEQNGIIDVVNGHIRNYWLANHHLISTKAQNGIFYSPYVYVLKGLNDLEDKIVEARKEQEREMKLVGGTTKVKSGGQHKKQNPNDPRTPGGSWTVELSEFVMTEGPYGPTQYERRRMEEKAASLLDIGEQRWRNVVRWQRLGDWSPSTHTPSLLMGTKWQHSNKVRSQEKRKTELLYLRVASRPFFISPPKNRRFSCGPIPPLGT